MSGDIPTPESPTHTTTQSPASTSLAELFPALDDRVLGGDGQRSALKHCIAGIDREV
jgi:hypothetical protein